MIFFDQENTYLSIGAAAEYFYCQRAAFYRLMHWENDLENPYLYKGREQHRVIERMPYKHRANAKIIYRYPVMNEILRIYGVCDAVIFPKRGTPYPVEYKTGKMRTNIVHRVQLCLQIACLEKMHNINITHGYIYFVESHRRAEIRIDAMEKAHILDGVRELWDKLLHPDIQSFPPCGNPFCSYHSIDDPVFYRKTRATRNYGLS